MNIQSTIIPIPKTRDPFVNAQLVPAGIDPVTKKERFWTSTWNSISGSIGVLVTESGEYRLYPFNPDNNEHGFYGASYGGNDVMWLSCFLDSITKLDLKTGETKTWKTGMPHSLSISGLVFDDKTKKVFWAAYCTDDFKNKGLTFNTITESVESRFDDIPLKNKQLRKSVRNIDGTYIFVNCVPDMELLWWDPVSDEIEIILGSQNISSKRDFLSYCVLIQNEEGAIYLPEFGWYDPVNRRFIEDKEPSRDMAWFGRDDKFAYGCETLSLGNTAIYKWNLISGDVECISEIPDSLLYQFCLTKSKKIVCVNMYGFFYKINAETGAIECSVKLDSDSVGHIDCIHQINNNRLLCTPFISQRFYEIDLQTGKGTDLGRATGGVGEVLKVVDINNKIYMASYTKGQLCEYDPASLARFPENPRIVVSPPPKAMRPIALCKNIDTIFYSCSLEYGHLGSMLIRYSPETGESKFSLNPIENHMIRSLVYSKKINKLIATTTFHADCKSCLPKADSCILAIIDPETLLPVNTLELENGVEYFHILGALTDEKYLCLASDYHMELNRGYKFYVLDIKDFSLISYPTPLKLEASNPIRIYSFEKKGAFIIVNKETVELWDMTNGEFIMKICDNPGLYKLKVQNDKLFMVCNKEIHVVPFVNK